MLVYLASTWDVLKQTAIEWWQDNALRLAASVSYYTALSLAPLILLILVAAGAIFGEEAVRGGVETATGDLVGPEAAAVIQQVIANASQPEGLTTAAIVGFITLMIGATAVFGELQDALNIIWDVQAKRGAWWSMIRTRLLSLAMVATIGFLMLVSLIATAVMAVMFSFFQHLVPFSETVWAVLHNLLTLAVVAMLFAMMFKFLPDAKVAWSDVWIGAFVTALLFTVGKYLIGLYLGHAAPGSAYGAAGSLVAMLVWVYYSSLILFFGAEFTQVYANRYGSHIEPKEHAEHRPHEGRSKDERHDQTPGAPGAPGTPGTSGGRTAHA